MARGSERGARSTFRTAYAVKFFTATGKEKALKLLVWGRIKGRDVYPIGKYSRTLSIQEGRVEITLFVKGRGGRGRKQGRDLTIERREEKILGFNNQARKVVRRVEQKR